MASRRKTDAGAGAGVPSHDILAQGGQPLLRLVVEIAEKETNHTERRLIEAKLASIEAWAARARRRRRSTTKSPSPPGRVERDTDIADALRSVLSAVARSRLPRLLAREARASTVLNDFDFVMTVLDGRKTEADLAVVDGRVEPTFEALLSEPGLLANTAAERRQMKPVLAGLDGRRGELAKTALVAAGESIVAIRLVLPPSGVREARIAAARSGRGERRRRRAV